MYHKFHNSAPRKNLFLRCLPHLSLPAIVVAVCVIGTAQSALAAGRLKASPTSLSFGNICEYRSSTKAVTLSNTGTASVTISNVSVSGSGFSSSSLSLPLTLAVGATTTLNVSFAPAAIGTLTGTLSVTSNAKNSPATVALSGTGATPQLRVYATGSFGNVTVGSSSTHSVTLQNPSTVNVTVSQATLTGTGFSITGLSLPRTVAAGQTVAFNVVFAPTSTGSFTGSLQVVSDANSSPSFVTLSGTGVAATSTPAVSLSASGLTFPGQPVGTSSAAQSVVLTNTGSAALAISSIALAGANAADFAQTNNCVTSVAAGANCTLSVTFTPSALGSRTASLAISDNATGSPQTVTLTGTGTTTAPTVSVTPTSLTFAGQTAGTTSSAQTVTLTNTGTTALTISSLALTGTNAGDFAQTNNCASSVAAGAKCSISITFTPSATGSRTASVSIADNATGSPQTVSLTGTGTAPAASLSPTTLTFSSPAVGSTSSAQTITLTNSGTAALTISSVALTGTNSSDFAQTNTCGSSVAAGANCVINLTFTPSATGTRTASVTITDNASGSPQTASLTGTISSAAVSLSTSSLAFSTQPIAVTSSSQSVTVTNTGNSTLSITSIGLSGTNAGDFGETNTCGASLNAGTNCVIAVMFTPTAFGARSASLSIADNASGSPQSVSLSGSGAHNVVLSWTASASSGVTGYYIYRGATAGGESATPLNSTPVNSTTFTDQSVTSGATYYYVVTAVGSNGVTQSSVSNEASACVPAT